MLAPLYLAQLLKFLWNAHALLRYIFTFFVELSAVVLLKVAIKSFKVLWENDFKYYYCSIIKGILH